MVYSTLERVMVTHHSAPLELPLSLALASSAENPIVTANLVARRFGLVQRRDSSTDSLENAQAKSADESLIIKSVYLAFRPLSIPIEKLSDSFCPLSMSFCSLSIAWDTPSISFDALSIAIH